MRSARDLLVVAVATPLLYASLGVAVRTLAIASGVARNGSFDPAPWSVLVIGAGPVDVVRFAVVLGILGAVAVGALDRGVYAPSGIAAVLFAAIAVFESPGPRHYATLGTFVLVAVLAAGGVEWTARNREAVRRLLADHDVRLGLAVGVLHVSVALAFETAESGFPFVSSPLAVAVGAVLVAGLGTSWAVPVVAFRRHGLVSPAVVAGGWFLWAVVLYVQHLPDLPLSPMQAILPFGLTPYPGYLFKWAVPLTVVLYVGLVEHVARSRIRQERRQRAASTGE